MNSLKKLPMALTVLGLGAVSSFAELKVNDNLGVSGFLDMSLSGEANDSTESLNASFDQFELDFMLRFGDKISARADVNAHPGTTNMHLNTSTGMAVDLEQGFVTYASGAAAFSAGRFLSSSGFEAAEPTGLYQYSVSKNLSGPAGAVYGGYQNGVSGSYKTPMFGLYGAVVSDLWNTPETDIMNSPGFEGQVSVTPAEGVTAKATYLFQMYDGDVTPGGDDNQQLLNVWASYAKGKITAAAEYNMLLSWMPDAAAPAVNDESGHGWLAMGNFKVNDNVAATLRYSGIIVGDGDPDTEITFSPSLLLSPNWLSLAEVRYDIDAEVTKYAVESTFSF